MTTLPPHLQPRLDRELDEGEVVRWVAQPSYRILRKAARDLSFGISVLLGIFCAMLITLGTLGLNGVLTADTKGEYWAMVVLAGVIFVCTVWGVISIFRNAKYVTDNTIYAITNRRAIIIVVHRNKSITERDYRGDELIHLARKESPDGSGTLTFESARGAGASAQTTGRHRFQAIEDVIGVERMLRKQFGES